MAKFTLRKNWKSEAVFLRKMAGLVKATQSDCDEPEVMERLMNIEQRLRDRADKLEAPETITQS